MVPVRRPGRPLSCPHPKASACSCPGRSSSAIAIPRGRRCECWSLARNLLDPSSSVPSPAQIRRASGAGQAQAEAAVAESDGSLYNMPFDGGPPSEQPVGVDAMGVPTAPSSPPLMPPMAWGTDFLKPSASSPAAGESHQFSTGIHSQAAAAPVPVPSIIINQPACADCCKQPQTVVVQPPPTMPYATLPRSGASVFVVVINSPPTMGPGTDPRAHGGGLPDVGIACLCGPECQCVGCLAHPFNDATEQYMRWAWGSGSTAGSSPMDATPADDALTPLALVGSGSGSGSALATGPKQVFAADDFFFLDYPPDTDVGTLGGLAPLAEGGERPGPGLPRPGTPTLADMD